MIDMVVNYCRNHRRPREKWNTVTNLERKCHFRQKRGSAFHADCDALDTRAGLQEDDREGSQAKVALKRKRSLCSEY